MCGYPERLPTGTNNYTVLEKYFTFPFTYTIDAYFLQSNYTLTNNGSSYARLQYNNVGYIKAISTSATHTGMNGLNVEIVLDTHLFPKP